MSSNTPGISFYIQIFMNSLRFLEFPWVDLIVFYINILAWCRQTQILFRMWVWYCSIGL